jgi:hypothetical protein
MSDTFARSINRFRDNPVAERLNTVNLDRHIGVFHTGARFSGKRVDLRPGE